MKINCPECQKVFEISNERLKKYDKQIKFYCPTCKKGLIKVDLDTMSTPQDSLHSFEVKRQASLNVSVATSAQPLSGMALKRNILRKLKDLPPMPKIVSKVHKIMANPNAGITDLVKLLEKDQSLVIKVLRLGNSAYYGVSGKISTVRRAAVLLGQKTLGEVVTMAGISNLMGKKLEGYGFDTDDLWRHSLAVGFGTKFIADRVKPYLSNDAFIAGLIHDAGKIVLDEYVLERKDEVQTFRADGNSTFLDVEKKILGIDHAQIAAAICKRWSIPNTINQAIRWHHRPSRSNGSEIALFLHVADHFAKISEIGTSQDDLRNQMEKDALESLGFQEKELDHLLVEVMESVETIAEEFQNI